MSNTSFQTAPNPPAAVVPLAPRPAPRGRGPLARALKAIASLRLTVVLFTLSMLLVFFGTLAQIDAGVWTVVKDYFRSFVVWIPFQPLVQFGQVFFALPKTMVIPGAFPFPGGWLLGGLLLLNLIAAHLVRFKVTWKRAGILIIHSGLILMMVGEFVTGVFAVEGNMIIDEGSSSNYVLHNRQAELAFVDSSAKAEDRVVVVPASFLKPGTTVQDEALPVDIEVGTFFINAAMRSPKEGETNPATEGFGKESIAVEKGEVSGTSTKQTVETPAVYLTFKDKKDGKPLGTYLMSVRWRDQPLTVDGKTYEVSLRNKRTYKPFSLELIKFRFDRYLGTNTPKNYSSEVRLRDPERGEDRVVLIRMNEPLFHRGETYYQADFDKETEKTTYLQVVRNPGWFLPYLSCIMVASGMLIHFGMNLITFLQRRAQA